MRRAIGSSDDNAVNQQVAKIVRRCTRKTLTEIPRTGELRHAQPVFFSDNPSRGMALGGGNGYKSSLFRSYSTELAVNLTSTAEARMKARARGSRRCGSVQAFVAVLPRALGNREAADNHQAGITPISPIPR